MSSVLDHVDAKIVEMLQADGRRPSLEIARCLGVSEGTVRKRIERLVRDKVIQISAWADPLQIGYQNYAVLMMSMDLRHLDRGAEEIAQMPEVFFLGTCIGEFNLFVSACFRSLEHMHEFMTQRLANVAGIQRVSTSHVTRVVKRDYSFEIVVGDDPNAPRRGRPASHKQTSDAPLRAPAPQKSSAVPAADNPHLQEEVSHG